VTTIDLTGKLIVFEGLDGSGKTTQARLLAARLTREGVDVVLTREPGGTPIGEQVRGILLDQAHSELLPLSELLLFIVSRAQHSHEVILPALRAGRTVIGSRYRLSSVAYQGYGRGVDLALVDRLNEEATSSRRADLTFLIDVPVKIALARRRDSDRIEREETAFHERVRRGFLEVAAADPAVRIVDGTGPASEVSIQVLEALRLPLCRSQSQSDMMKRSSF